MLFIGVKAPRFNLNADSDVFVGFKIFFVRIICQILFSFNSFITVSELISHSRASARIPAPSVARLIMTFFTRACSRYSGIPRKMFYGNSQDYNRHTTFYHLKFRMCGHTHFRKTDILTLLLPRLSPS
jgi:hypothetical protein